VFALLVGGLIALSALVLVLSQRLRHLTWAYRDLRRLSLLPHTGVVMPTFRAVTIGGDSVTVGQLADSAGRQVLFVFNITCPYCRRIVPVWHRLADSVSKLAHVQVLGLSLDAPNPTRDYASQRKLRYPVVTFPEPKLQRLYRTVAVPQTVVLDWIGTVLYARTGTLDSAAYDSVVRAVLNRSPRSP